MWDTQVGAPTDWGGGRGTHRWVHPQTDEVGVWDTHGWVLTQTEKVGTWNTGVQPCGYIHLCSEGVYTGGCTLRYVYG